MLSHQYWPQLFDSVEKNKGWLQELSKNIWSHPEIGHQEFFASEQLTDSLKKHGFEVQKPIAAMQTSFIAHYTSSLPGPTIAFVAEYDALPGLGHGCAHNLFCCSALGSAIALKSILDKLGGKLVVLGSPAEEGVVPYFGGKVSLIEAGYLKDVDVAFTSHGENETVIERDLVSSMAPEVSFRGFSVHAGGSPEKGINALTAGICMINNMNAIRQHNLPEDVINIIIKDGGLAANTIPDFCCLALSLRSKTYDGLMTLWEKAQKCAEAAALVTGCTLETSPPQNIYKDTQSNHHLGKVMAHILTALEIPFKQHDSRGYAWDTGNISYEVPTLASYFKIGPEDIICHTEEFKTAANSAEGYAGMILSAKSMAAVACEYIVNKELQEQVWQEFKLKRKKTDFLLR